MYLAFKTAAAERAQDLAGNVSLEDLRMCVGKYSRSKPRLVFPANVAVALAELKILVTYAPIFSFWLC